MRPNHVGASAALRWVGQRPGASFRSGNWGWGAGYAFTSDGRLLVDDEIAEELDESSQRASSLNGCFAAVMAGEGAVTVVTDRYGSIPVYLHRGRSGLV